MSWEAGWPVFTSSVNYQPQQWYQFEKFIVWSLGSDTVMYTVLSPGTQAGYHALHTHSHIYIQAHIHTSKHVHAHTHACTHPPTHTHTQAQAHTSRNESLFMTKGTDGGCLLFQVPILPVVFSSYNDFYSKNERRFDTGRCMGKWHGSCCLLVICVNWHETLCIFCISGMKNAYSIT